MVDELAKYMSKTHDLIMQKNIGISITCFLTQVFVNLLTNDSFCVPQLLKAKPQTIQVLLHKIRVQDVFIKRIFIDPKIKKR